MYLGINVGTALRGRLLTGRGPGGRFGQGDTGQKQDAMTHQHPAGYSHWHEPSAPNPERRSLTFRFRCRGQLFIVRHADIQ
jgi:hypothetical protein